MESKNFHNGHRERLRNKYVKAKDSLSEHELLELLLTYCIPRKNTNELAHLLIEKFGTINNVIKADPSLIESICGVGKSTSIFLSLIGYLKDREDEKEVIKISSLESIKDYAIKLFKNYKEEVFYVLFIDKNNNVYDKIKFESNSKSMVEINIPSLVESLIIKKPFSILIAHNHFAKYPRPSNDDDIFTAKLYSVLIMHQINLLDHLIVSGNEVFSYFYENRLQEIKNEVNIKFR